MSRFSNKSSTPECRASSAEAFGVAVITVAAIGYFVALWVFM
jgi:hypothetical protein